MIILNSKLCESYGSRNHPESSIRLKNVREFLLANSLKVIQNDVEASEEELLLVHSPEHLSRLKNSIEENPDCPTYSPAYSNMYKHASLAAGIALESARTAYLGQNSFSLARPPGHHASKDKSMGFCYINNTALAAVYLRNKTKKNIFNFKYNN